MKRKTSPVSEFSESGEVLSVGLEERTLKRLLVTPPDHKRTAKTNASPKKRKSTKPVVAKPE